MLLRCTLAMCLLLCADLVHASTAEDQTEAYQRCIASAERARELTSNDRHTMEQARREPASTVPAQYREALGRIKKIANIPAGVQLELIPVQSNGTAAVLSTGSIFVSTRLWRGRVALDQEEATALLAHEVAHLELSHGRNRLCEAVAALGDDSIPLLQANQALQNAVLASGDSRLALQMMQNNHERELSADRRAADMLKALGISSKAVGRMLLKLAGGGAAQYSWTHPALETRLENLELMKGHGAPY